MGNILLTYFASIFFVEKPKNSQAPSIAGDERHSKVLFEVVLLLPFVFFVSVRRKLIGIVSQIGFFGFENSSSAGGRNFDIQRIGNAIYTSPTDTAFCSFDQGHKYSVESHELGRPHHEFAEKAIHVRRGAKFGGDCEQLVEMMLLCRSQVSQFRVIQRQPADFPQKIEG